MHPAIRASAKKERACAFNENLHKHSERPYACWSTLAAGQGGPPYRQASRSTLSADPDAWSLTMAPVFLARLSSNAVEDREDVTLDIRDMSVDMLGKRRERMTCLS